MPLNLCLGENSKDVGHVAGEGLSKGLKEANPEDLAAVPAVRSLAPRHIVGAITSAGY